MKLQKITKKEKQRQTHRLYDDACGIAHALDLVGERWALLVMRDLLFGPKRFSDLRDSLPGISANVLTQRLEGLEASGLVIKRKLPPPAASQVYELTPWGYESEPIIRDMGRWAARSPAHDPTLPVSTVSVLLSMRTMLDAKRAEGIDARIGFALGGETFVGHLHDGQLDIARGPTDGADATFTGTARYLAAALYGGVPLAALEKKGALKAEGDRALAEKYLTLFVLPPKAELAG
ncbi:MAG: transcriptional regulator [Rhodospirillales bacterium]|jgi:DNA-binding HxlR family transcriptional regulator|nr:transcriptional regulator [Rhodospirillales bacterium]